MLENIGDVAHSTPNSRLAGPIICGAYRKMKYKQYVIIPKKPKMSVGKIASQVAHATLIALEQENKHRKALWKYEGMAVIVLQCKDSNQLSGIAKYFEQWSVPHHLYIDEGMTEVDMGTPTALATGIFTEDMEWMLSTMRLYK